MPEAANIGVRWWQLWQAGLPQGWRSAVHAFPVRLELSAISGGGYTRLAVVSRTIIVLPVVPVWGRLVPVFHGLHQDHLGKIITDFSLGGLRNKLRYRICKPVSD